MKTHLGYMKVVFIQASILHSGPEEAGREELVGDGTRFAAEGCTGKRSSLWLRNPPAARTWLEVGFFQPTGRPAVMEADTPPDPFSCCQQQLQMLTAKVPHQVISWVTPKPGNGAVKAAGSMSAEGALDAGLGLEGQASSFTAALWGQSWPFSLSVGQLLRPPISL